MKKSWLLFLNIPIAILYAYFVMYLLNTERLTIINETGHELTNVQISGCEQRTIGSLDLSEKVSLWVPIKQGGCYIKLSYYQEGELEEEIISFYKSGLDGQIRTFRIGVEEFIFMH
ncbi:MAG: hypothetical protein LAT51_09675 [Flavobacteriaceae bacterium]|nr:hypothetical protein [Flavobacteriaceae bacterium]